MQPSFTPKYSAIKAWTQSFMKACKMAVLSFKKQKIITYIYILIAKWGMYVHLCLYVYF